MNPNRCPCLSPFPFPPSSLLQEGGWGGDMKEPEVQSRSVGSREHWSLPAYLPLEPFLSLLHLTVRIFMVGNKAKVNKSHQARAMIWDKTGVVNFT